MNEDISFLYSKTVTTKDKELIQNYINSLSELERDNFSLIVNDLITANLKITHNAIRLALKVYKDTNIKTFPFILKLACKSYSVSDGTYAFSMYLLTNKNECISSCRRVKDLLLKDNKIITYTSMAHGGDQIIDI